MTDGSASIRGLMAIGLMICAFVLVLTGKLTAEQFTDLSKWVFAFYASSKAITTAVGLWSASTPAPAPAPTTTVLAVTAPDPHTPTVVPPVAKA